MLRLMKLVGVFAFLNAIASGSAAQEKTAAGNDDYKQFGIFEKTAPSPQTAEPVTTTFWSTFVAEAPAV